MRTCCYLTRLAADGAGWAGGLGILRTISVVTLKMEVEYV